MMCSILIVFVATIMMLNLIIIESTPVTRPRNCFDIKKRNTSATNGIYTIYPKSCQPEIGVDVLCDMDTLGGGWTIIQHRHDVQSHVDFKRNWTEYKDGFGHLDTEHWIGLDNIHELTSQGQTTLLIMLTDVTNAIKKATYTYFHISDETYNFKINIHGYSGNAGDSMTYHNGMNFSTYDRDLDTNQWGHLAQLYKGGWWFKDSLNSNLNGFYHVGKVDTTHDDLGIYWGHWTASTSSLKRAEMKLRVNY